MISKIFTVWRGWVDCERDNKTLSVMQCFWGGLTKLAIPAGRITMFLGGLTKVAIPAGRNT